MVQMGNQKAKRSALGKGGTERQWPLPFGDIIMTRILCKRVAKELLGPSKREEKREAVQLRFVPLANHTQQAK